MRKLRRVRPDTKWQYLEAEARRMFAEKVNECVEWPFSKTDRGYGRVKRGDKTLRVHRYSYAVSRGVDLDVVPDLVVRHSCDNPSCFNPTHLEIGTHKDNSRDRTERKRYWNCKGTLHPNAKLSEADVRQIRAMLAIGISGVSVAAKFHVHPTLVGQIRLGKKWAHLPD